MKSIINLATILFTIQVTSSTKIIECDYLTHNHTCYINETKISEPTVTIKCTDLEVTVLAIEGQAVNFLPLKLAETFPKLDTFVAVDGKFRTISKINFENLENLFALVLQSEELTEVEKNSFEDLVNLEMLKIHHTGLKYFHSDTFKPLVNLKYLFIHNNQLEMLHPQSFDTLLQLQMVSFAANKLFTLNRQLFLNKEQLHVIDGSANNFVYLDEITFDGLKLMDLKLRGNGSDCSLYNYNNENDDIDIEEVKRDIRDECRGKDFKVMQIHAKMLEIVKSFGDKLF